MSLLMPLIQSMRSKGGVASKISPFVNWFVDIMNQGSTQSQEPQQLGIEGQNQQSYWNQSDVGGVEGTNFMDLLLKLQYPYLFNNKGVR